jgi:lantibiotic modifying enzyme
VARRAFWHADRCTWVEAVPVVEGQNPAISVAAEADLYGGVSGIGWFLAEAAVRTGDAFLRRTAIGALRQAETRVGRLAEQAPHGFYGGAAGTGAALVAAGTTLDDAACVEAGRRLLAAVPVDTDRPFTTDLISGLAGTALALVLAGRTLGDADLIGRASEAAAALLRQGEPGPEGGLSWPTMPQTRANLTGYAHGTAGIAYALLAVDAAAPDPALRGAAAAAMAYEARCFNAAAGGWPDYRSFAMTPADQPTYPVAWCHGASGILQARLAAAGDARVQGDVEYGCAATVREAQRMLAVPGADFTLCHGLAGLGDALLDAARAGLPDAAAAVVAIANHGWQHFHAAERAWPSGLLTREEISGLMLGNAGIGWFYLRLSDPSLESPLVPGASRFAGAQPMSPSPE